MNIKFFVMNAGWAALNPKDANNTRKAMKKYREEHPNCEITGSSKNVQVHHIIPVWADPTKAADFDNFICLSTSANIHCIFGHDGDFKTKYVDNIKEISKKILAYRGEYNIIKRVKIKSQSNENIFKSLWKKIFCKK